MNEDWASKAYHEIIEAGTDWADKDAAAKFLDDTRKPMQLIQLRLPLEISCKL